jgi:hypothetical protein
MGLMVIRSMSESSMWGLWAKNGFKYNWPGSRNSRRLGKDIKSKEISLVYGVKGEIGI